MFPSPEVTINQAREIAFGACADEIVHRTLPAPFVALWEAGRLVLPQQTHDAMKAAIFATARTFDGQAAPFTEVH